MILFFRVAFVCIGFGLHSDLIHDTQKKIFCLRFYSYICIPGDDDDDDDAADGVTIRPYRK